MKTRRISANEKQYNAQRDAGNVTGVIFELSKKL